MTRIGQNAFSDSPLSPVRQWRPVGSLKALRLRSPGSPGPQSVQEAVAVAHEGLSGDRHAGTHSPRQMLIAEERVYGELDLPAFSLRESLLIDFPTNELRSGSLLRIGADVVLWITFQCEPCARLERHQPGLAKALKRRRGVLARVLEGGTLRVGDLVGLSPSPIPPMSDDWKLRVANIVQQVPPGQFIEYRQLAELAGVSKTYCRAFPRVLSQLSPDVAMRAQPSGAVPAEQRWAGDELFDVRPDSGD